MKIVYLVHQFFPEDRTGTEKFILKVSSMAHAAGYGVKVITYNSIRGDDFFSGSIGDILYKEFTYGSIPVVALRHKIMPKDLDVALGDKSMAGIAEHFLTLENPDIVHVGHPQRVNEFIAAARLLGIPYVITLTDFWLICPKFILMNSKGNLCTGPEEGKTCRNLCPEYASDWIIQRLSSAKEILFGAKRIISPSRFLAAGFKKELGDLDITVVNHGMNYREMKENRRDPKKGDKLVFCYAGCLANHKGVHVLIDAFKKIVSDDIVIKI